VWFLLFLAAGGPERLGDVENVRVRRAVDGDGTESADDFGRVGRRAEEGRRKGVRGKSEVRSEGGMLRVVSCGVDVMPEL